MENLFEVTDGCTQNTLGEFPDLDIDLGVVLEGNGFNQSLLDDVDLHLECEDESQDFSYVETFIEDETFPAPPSIPTGLFAKPTTSRSPSDPLDDQHFLCESESFTTNPPLLDHKHSTQTEKNMFPCDQCGYVGQLYSNLQKHRKRKHGCDKIGSTYAESSDESCSGLLSDRKIPTHNPFESICRTEPLSQSNTCNSDDPNDSLSSNVPNQCHNKAATRRSIDKGYSDVVPVSMITNFNHEIEDSDSDYALSSDNEETDCESSPDLVKNQQTNPEMISSLNQITYKHKPGTNPTSVSNNTFVRPHVHRSNSKTTLANCYRSFNLKTPDSASFSRSMNKSQSEDTSFIQESFRTVNIYDFGAFRYKSINNTTYSPKKPSGLKPSNLNNKSLHVPHTNSKHRLTNLSIQNKTIVFNNQKDQPLPKNICVGSEKSGAILITGKTKNFVCPFEGCNKSFRDNYNRNIHVRVHTNDMPFKCTLCDYKTKQKTSLKLHEISKHTPLVSKKICA